MGVLFTLGMMDDEIEKIVKGREPAGLGKILVEEEIDCDNIGTKIGENDGKLKVGSPIKKVIMISGTDGGQKSK